MHDFTSMISGSTAAPSAPVGMPRGECLQSALCRNVRRFAHERGMTFSELAKKAGVAKAQIYRVMSGQSSPSLEWIVRLARGLEVDALVLLSPSYELPSHMGAGYGAMGH